MDYYPGAYSEYTLGWGDLCFPLSKHVSTAEAAMADILCVAVHVCNKIHLYPGATILCIGGGPAGLAVAQVTMVKGAEKVFVSEPSEICRTVANHYKGIRVVNPYNTDVREYVLNQNKGKKCAAVVDSVGSNETFNLGINLLEESGIYINVAVHENKLNFKALSLGAERIFTTSANAFYSDVKIAYALINTSQIDVIPWITHRFNLVDYQIAFDLLLAPVRQAFKVIFEH